jgi:hypothetical protein
VTVIAMVCTRSNPASVASTPNSTPKGVATSVKGRLSRSPAPKAVFGVVKTHVLTLL